MKEQVEYIEKILRLKKEKKDHDIHFLVDTDIVSDDEYSWYSGEISQVEIGVWLETDWGIKTSLADIEECFWENDEIYAEAHPSYVPELDELMAKAKPAILVRVWC